MKQIFLDTNVVLDFLANRKPYADNATWLFNMAARQKISIAVSAITYNNLYYILKQSLSQQKTIQVLKQLKEWSRIIEVNDSIIHQALYAEFRDFEDAIQYSCASTISNLVCLVTRNTKDFKLANMPVLTPAEAIVLLKSLE